MSRLPLIPDEARTDAQRRAAKVVVTDKRPGVIGPYPALMRSPELCERTARLGDFLRFGTSLPARLSEMAILITGQRWRAQYEWFAHAPLAKKGGLADDIIEALRLGVRPKNMQPDEAALYDFCVELHATGRVGDANYARALELFGEAGVVELVGINGYYCLVSMVLNVAQVPLPAGVSAPFPED